MKRRRKTPSLACLAAALCAAAPHAEAAHEVETYSFGFRNFKSNEESGCSEDITWKAYRNAYIGVTVENFKSSLDWVIYSELVKPKTFRVGHCFGISLLSLLVAKRGGHLGVCAPTLQYSGDLGKSCPPEEPDKDKRYSLGPKDPHVRSIIDELHFHQFNLKAMLYYGDQLLNGGKAKSGKAAYDALQIECPAVISLCPGYGEGHAMLAYKTEVRAGGGFRILVYDNNNAWAAQQDWYQAGKNQILVEASGNWKYVDEVNGKDWSGGPSVLWYNHIIVYPRSVIQDKDRSIAGHDLGLFNDLQQKIAFSSGSDGGDLAQVTDAQGRRLYRPGTEDVDLDPSTGLRTIVPFSPSDGDGESGGFLYHIREDRGDPLDFEVRAGTAGYVIVIGSARSYITVTARGGSGVDLLRLERIGTSRPSVVLFNTVEAASYDVKLTQVIEADRRARVFEVKSLALPPGTPFELAVEQNEGALKVTSPVDRATFDLSLTNVVGPDELCLESRGQSIEAGESLVLCPRDWSDTALLDLVRWKEELTPERSESIVEGLYGPAKAPAGPDFEGARDIGMGRGGSIAYAASTETYSMTPSATALLDDPADALQFAYRPLEGDFEATVEVLSAPPAPAGGSIEYGLMVRKDVSPASRSSAVEIAARGATAEETRWAFRTVHGDPSSVDRGQAFLYPPERRPRFMNLVRRGSVFFGHVSRDGESWDPIGADAWRDLDPGATLLVGFAAGQRSPSGLLGSPVTFRVHHLGPIEPPLPDLIPHVGLATSVPIAANGFEGADGSAPAGMHVVLREGTFTPQVRGGRLRLADQAAPRSAAGAYCDDPIEDIDGSIYRFDFDLHFRRDPLAPEIGGGAAFVVVGGRDLTRIGRSDGALGYEGLARDPRTGANLGGNSLAIEFDVRTDGVDDGDGAPGHPGAYHIGVDVQGSARSAAQASLDLPDIFAPEGVHARVLYDRGRVQVLLRSGAEPDGALRKALEVDLLPISFGAPDPSAACGFTASTGDGGITAEVDDLRVARIDCDAVQEVVRIGRVPSSPVPLGTIATLDGSGSTGGSAGAPRPVTYLWRVISGGAAILGPSYGPTVNLRTSAEGPVVVRLTVDDGVCDDPASAVASFTVGERTEVPFRRDDPNGDGASDITDAISILNYMFLNGTPPPCLKAADIDANGAVEITDPILFLGYLYLGGEPPRDPCVACGIDPANEGPTCDSFPPCER